MITDEEIFELYEQQKGIIDFARAIYQPGRQHQRESDARLRDDDMELALRTGQDGIALAFRMYREGILNNTGELK